MSTRRRATGGQARATGDGRTIEARVIRYEDRPDSFGTIWARGVFTESLNRRLPVLAWAHDWAEPIGKGVSWRDGADGPYVTFRISDPDAVPRARQAIAQLAEGTLTDVSVGFFNAQRRDPTEAERKRWPGVREIIERAELDEVSIVLRGAVEGAEVVDQRSIDQSKSYGWWLAREYAEGRMSRAEFERLTALEREILAALETVQRTRLRWIGTQLDALSPEERMQWARLTVRHRGGRP